MTARAPSRRIVQSERTFLAAEMIPNQLLLFALIDRRDQSGIRNKLELLLPFENFSEDTEEWILLLIIV